MIGYVRARGLLWAAPGAVLAVLGAAWFADWLESQPRFDHLARVPAVVLGGLLAAVLAAPGLHRVEDEVEGSAARPSRVAELAVSVAMVLGAAGLAALAIPLHSLQRGGLELARDIVGLAGLGLLGGALAGARLAWLLPFGWTSVSYLGVTRDYGLHSGQAVVGWLMFPADVALTWWVAGALLLTGLAAYAWGGFVPRPQHHPLR